MKRQLSALALSGALGAGSVYLVTDGVSEQIEVVPDLQADALLAAASEACRAEVMLVDKGAVACTQDGVSVMDGDKEPMHNLWVCNGAVMPERVQRCLSGPAEQPKCINWGQFRVEARGNREPIENEVDDR